jgi:CRISPR-associated protein Csd2
MSQAAIRTDSDNQPRIEIDSDHGLVSDVCLKRKIRNYVAIAKNGANGYGIHVSDGAILSEVNQAVAAEIKADLKNGGADKVKATLASRYYDIRTFGSVLAGKGDSNFGGVRGPVQLSFARSLDPVAMQRHCITRCAANKREERRDGGEKEAKTMGGKWTVPYAAYRVHGYISAPLAEKTGFSEADLEALWDALTNMFDHDRSAARGEMSACKLIVFKHASRMGNAPAKKLFEAVAVKNKAADGVARKWADYDVAIDTAAIPKGVELIDKF